jgi:hypothetical protein
MAACKGIPRKLVECQSHVCRVLAVQTLQLSLQLLMACKLVSQMPVWKIATPPPLTKGR